jgi:translation initiation factor IF-1
MSETRPKPFTTAQVVDVLTPTLLTVLLDDGSQLQAVLSPELRHTLLRDGKKLEIKEGTVVDVELSPVSDQKCRIVRLAHN